MDTKTHIKNFVKNHKELVGLVVCMILFFIFVISMGILDEKEEKEASDSNNLEAGTPAQRIEKYIEHEDFQGARVVLQKMKPKEIDEEDVNMLTSKKKLQAAQEKKRNEQKEFEKYQKKISRAQISSLINKGDYSTAVSIAKEDLNFESYFDMVTNGLPSYYGKNIQDVILLMTSISFPNKGYNKDWDNNYNYWSEDEINNLIANFNNKVGQLMTIAKASDDINFAKTVSAYLKPQYKQVKGKYGSEWEGTPSDYTDANRIKKEVGIK